MYLTLLASVGLYSFSSPFSLTMIGRSGIILVRRLDSGMDRLEMRATSLTASLAAIVPKVMTCEMWSAP